VPASTASGSALLVGTGLLNTNVAIIRRRTRCRCDVSLARLLSFAAIRDSMDPRATVVGRRITGPQGSNRCYQGHTCAPVVCARRAVWRCEIRNASCCYLSRGRRHSPSDANDMQRAAYSGSASYECWSYRSPTMSSACASTPQGDVGIGTTSAWCALQLQRQQFGYQRN
jgi:hypothetical protein